MTATTLRGGERGIDVHDYLAHLDYRHAWTLGTTLYRYDRKICTKPQYQY